MSFFLFFYYMAMFFSFCCFEGLVLVPLLYFPLDFVFRNMFFDVFCHIVDIIFAWIFIHTEWVFCIINSVCCILSLQKAFITALSAIFITRSLHLTRFCMNFKCTTSQLNTFSACIFRFERFAILHLSLLNKSERYYDHKELWVIVKNFSVTHGVGFRSYPFNVT